MKNSIICLLFISLVNLYVVESGHTFLGTNGKYYYVSHPLQKNWWQADRHCKYLGMSLVDITSEYDTVAIEEIIKSKDEFQEQPFFWIGATDQGCESCFYWVNSGQPVIYSNWGNNQPDNAGGVERCVEITNDNHIWNDNQCKEEKYFICDQTNYLTGSMIEVPSDIVLDC